MQQSSFIGFLSIIKHPIGLPNQIVILKKTNDRYFDKQRWLRLVAEWLADPEIQVQTMPGAIKYEQIFWTNWTSINIVFVWSDWKWRQWEQQNKEACLAPVVYLCIIFYSMHSIFALPGWRHKCILPCEYLQYLVADPT